MRNQLVAGTVMLNSANGDKKFLVRKINENFDFVMTPIDGDHTSLACILQELKSEVRVDVNSIDLVELTNVQMDSKKMPFFVFEMEETVAISELAESYAWETPKTLRTVLNNFKISGVPIFE